MNISSHGRGDVAGTGGTREMALAHYAVRSGLPAENIPGYSVIVII